MRRTLLTGLVWGTLSCSGDKSSSETGMDTQSLEPVDADSDGFDESEDCDDNNPEIYPGSVEICDEVDNDCDDEIDEADALDAPTWYLDSDSDGYGDELEAVRQCSAPSGYVAENKAGFDCDDGDAAFHPGADESDCTDPNDYNCDGSVAYADADADGWAACEECDDSDAAIHPDAVEICDELDNDCDSLVDDADDDLDLASASDWYRDADSDGFGREEDSQRACLAPMDTSLKAQKAMTAMMRTMLFTQVRTNRIVRTPMTTIVMGQWPMPTPTVMGGQRARNAMIRIPG